MGWIKKHKVVVMVSAAVLIVALVVVFVVPGIFSRKRSEGTVTKQNTIKLEKMNLTDSVSATGTIESAKSTTVSADVQNIEVKSVLVNVGDKVTKGQKLITFDKSDLKQALDDAKEEYAGTVSQASSEVSQAYQTLSEARETYASEKKRLEKELKTAKENLKKAKKEAKNSSSDETDKAINGTASKTDGSSDTLTVEQAQSAYDQAKENLENQNKQNKKAITQAAAQVTTANNNKTKQIKQAKKTVRDAKETYDAAAIKASMDGTVTALGVSEGDTYNGSDAVEISDLSDFRVSTTVTEYDITNVKVGQRVVILTDATGDTEIEGEVTYVALTTGSSTLDSGNTGENGGMSSSGSSSSSDSGYEVVIKLKDIPDSIREGMTAKCSIVLNEASDVYAVPYDAIHTDSDNKSVIYVFDSTGNRKEIDVEKGMETDYYVEVKSDELSDDMSVIIPTDSSNSKEEKTEDKSENSGALDGMMGGGMPGGERPDFGGGNGGFPGGR